MKFQCGSLYKDIDLKEILILIYLISYFSSLKWKGRGVRRKIPPHMASQLDLCFLYPHVNAYALKHEQKHGLNQVTL